jgi:hypothetical protein
MGYALIGVRIHSFIQVLPRPDNKVLLCAVCENRGYALGPLQLQGATLP